jgi:thiosulfate dehydrogenase (quinone) large subunit
MQRRPTSITPGMALLPVRLFLGVTFVYAGYQKLSDPGFLTPGAPTYIGTQLHAFASGTPGGFLLRWFALPFPRAAGVGVALAEIAVGLLTTAGMLTRAAALAGFGLNLVLFLTASWATTPYFLGSDIVFCFAWLPFVMVGAAEQPAVDTLLLERRASGRAQQRTRSGAHVYGPAGPDPQTRATMLRRGLIAAGAGTLTIAAIATAMRGSVRLSPPSTTLAGPSGPTRRRRHPGSAHHTSGGSTGSAGSTGSTGSGGGQPSVPSGAVRLGPSSALKSDAAAVYRDPGDGSPDIVVRHSDGSLAAFSAVCTHAGCQVGFASGVLVCPCHGSEFSASTGAVLRGPAVTALARKHVIERRGSIYAV